MTTPASILSLLVLLPVAGAIAVALTPRQNAGMQKAIGLGLTTFLFLLSLLLVRDFKPIAGMQFEVNHAWIPDYGIAYHLGIDGISLWLILLTTFLTPLALLGSWTSIHDRVREFVVFMLLL
jgi:NADH-quinone oxidoreductase subunit M